MEEFTLRNGVICAAFIWTGFVVNYAFQNARPVLIAIDADHWLAVLLVMGAIIGVMGVSRPAAVSNLLRPPFFAGSSKFPTLAPRGCFTSAVPRRLI